MLRDRREVGYGEGGAPNGWILGGACPASPGLVIGLIPSIFAQTSGSYGELVSSIESRLCTARAMILSGLLSFTSMENTALTAWVQRWERADSMCTFWRQFGASLGEYRQATEGQAPVW